MSRVSSISRKSKREGHSPASQRLGDFCDALGEIDPEDSFAITGVTRISWDAETRPKVEKALWLLASGNHPRDVARRCKVDVETVEAWAAACEPQLLKAA